MRDQLNDRASMTREVTVNDNVPNNDPYDGPPEDVADRLLAEAQAVAARRRAEARAVVMTAVTITGRQVPDVLEETAAMLLAALWKASEPFGVTPEDWAAVAALPMSCLDVLVAVERRPRNA